MNIKPNAEWEAVKDIVYDALSEPPNTWPEFLDRRCGDDPSLRSEVEVLLRSYDSSFLETSVLERTAPLPPALEPGASLSHYEIVKLLGRGGMGEVYLARCTNLDRPAAIKIIHADSGLGQKAAARLLREARAVARLQHPGICSVYEVGEADGMPFISMQYIEGSTLQELMAGRAIEPKTAFAFARQIAEALDAAHQHGVIHRDVKPANVMIDAANNLKVLDFGLAKETFPGSAEAGQTATGMIAGTVQYMSPEHLRGQAVSPQTDVWSLGVVLYQMLTGRLPFVGETKADLISSVLNDELKPVRGLSSTNEQAVNHVLRRALAKDLEDRYQTIFDFCKDLQGLESTGNVLSVRTAPLTGRAWPVSLRLRRWALATAILFSVAAILAFLVWNRPASRANAFAASSDKPFKISTIHSVKRKGAGGLMDLSFSPDGSRIAFVLSEPGKQSIQVLRTADHSVMPLTDGDLKAGSPVWSPDGERVAFVTKVSGKEEVWAVPASGGAPTTLATFDDSSISPELKKWSNDGGRFFFDDGRGPGAIEIGTSQITKIDTTGIPGTIGRGFSISSDESAILVAVVGNGEKRFWHKSLASGNVEMMPNSGPIIGAPGIFPDARTFVYSADDGDAYQLYLGGLDGSAPRPVTASAFSAAGPALSSDGGTIAYVSTIGEANIFRTSIATGLAEAITDRAHMQVLAAMSPDASSIAYQTINDPSKVTSGQLKIVTTRADGSRVDTEIPGKGCCARWLSGGNRLAFIQGAFDNIHIRTYDVSQGTQKQITRVPLTPVRLQLAPLGFDRWPFEASPDGSRLAYVKRTTARDEIRVVDADGSSGDGTTIALSDAPARIRGMKWSSDGSQLAFSMSELGDHTKDPGRGLLFLLRDGQTSKFAQFETTVRVLGWSDSSDAVFATLEGDNELKVISVAIGSGRPTRQMAVLSNATPTSLDISPDRRHVSYSVMREGIRNVCVTEFTTGRETCLTSNTDPTVYYSGVTWAFDSQSVTYSRQSGRMQIELISPREKEINE